ncbi:MAG TPA: helix-turn-helix domain-containing protein, partial [Candidatus Cybelea sp.]|nr:helix-turn-helix domain-containing protein [Candidatus Cybelea sp.]
MSQFGSLLRRHRLAAGLSQEALAEGAQMSVEGLSALERGYRQRPQRQTIVALADALRLTDDALREFQASVEQKPEIVIDESADESRLPIALATFIGREKELAEIGELLRSSRLVTVTGSGGIGKTQTAVRVARALRGTGIFGARLVSLAALDTTGPVVAAVASALGVQEQTGRSLAGALLAHLRNKNLLLILDNCEHVIEDAAAAAAELLGGCARLRILATSRQPLQIDGERTYRLPSLQETEAVALFSDRARAVNHGFALTGATEPVVAEICRRLDGIPLAIELAAARLNVLSLKTVAAMIDDRFRILAGGSRTALPRQQTMHATIDWSYELLQLDERRVYEWLSVFSGGCTLEGAVAVAPSEEKWRSEMLDLLSSLIDKSLLTVDFSGSQTRYRFLESFRRHAAEKLAVRGEAEIVARRHAEVSLAFAAAFERARHWDLYDVEPELDNARAAIDWATAAGDLLLAIRIASGFAAVWRMRRGDAQPRRWFEALLPHIDETAEPAVAAQAWRMLASLRLGVQRIEAAQRAIGLAEACGDSQEYLAGLYQLTSGLIDTGRLDEAETASTTYLRICNERDMLETRRYAGAMETRAILAARRGNFVEARRLYAEGLALTQRVGSALAVTSFSHNLAELEHILGNHHRALELAIAAAEGARRSRLTRLEAIALTNAAA